jgi:hypothetical protein
MLLPLAIFPIDAVYLLCCFFSIFKEIAFLGNILVVS